MGHPVRRYGPLSRSDLYQRLQDVDAAILAVDDSSATESRVPAKVYDYLAPGGPVIAICPERAALLHVPGADRFHYLHHRDVHGRSRVPAVPVKPRLGTRASKPGTARAPRYGRTVASSTPPAIALRSTCTVLACWQEA